MHYTDPVYRPPLEEDSLLLEVTAGCSHNACVFCDMYRDVPFCIAPMEQIEEDLLEARTLYEKVERVFLVNGDPFVLSAERLKKIAEMIVEIFPEVKFISTYASIKNVMDKTDEELKELRALRMNELNIGIESGYDKVLEGLNKGYTLEEAKRQMERLRAAGIDYSLNLILGAAGAKEWERNALANAKLLNETQPYLFFLSTLHVEAGTPLCEAVQKGEFLEATLGQNVEEEILLLENLELKDTYFYGSHTSNVVRVSGRLPDYKEGMLKYFRTQAGRFPRKIWNSNPKRAEEGRPILY